MKICWLRGPGGWQRTAPAKARVLYRDWEAACEKVDLEARNRSTWSGANGFLQSFLEVNQGFFEEEVRGSMLSLEFYHGLPMVYQWFTPGFSGKPIASLPRRRWNVWNSFDKPFEMPRRARAMDVDGAVGMLGTGHH